MMQGIRDWWTSRRILKTLKKLPDSIDCWGPGDTAVCVGNGPWSCMIDGSRAIGPTYLSAHRVSYVAITVGPQFLSFQEFPDSFYLSCYFRKLTPDAAKACNKDFAKLVRKSTRERIDA